MGALAKMFGVKSDLYGAATCLSVAYPLPP
jgi:hypothetical protein